MHRHPRLNREKVRNPTSSEVLTHVCSYWRRVALNSLRLWARIDLSPCQVVSNSLLPRSAAFAGRAGGALLDIFVTDPVRQWSSGAPLDQFIEAVAPRIRSLDLRIYQTLRTDTYRNVLSACLSHCAPGTFTTLIATREPDTLSSTYIFFDMPESSIPEHGVGFYQQIFTVASEAVLQSIKVMRLCAFYPFWTSKAYHGLVELRLTTRTSDVSISGVHLRGILRASPGLRVLEFELKIVDLSVEDLAAPVRLEHLEVLNIHKLNYRLMPYFLRMIEPGSRPLQFSLSSAPDGGAPRYSFDGPSKYWPFFSRANITMVYANDFSVNEIIGMLHLCPHLQTLACCRYSSVEELAPGVMISHQGIQYLFMIHCDVEIDMLSRWINIPTLEKLVLYRCSIYQNREFDDPLDESQIQIELPGPNLSFIDYNMPNPVENWELFDSNSDL